MISTSGVTDCFIYTNIKQYFNVHHLELLGVDGRIILKKQDGVSWTGFIRLTIETNTLISFVFP